MLGSAVSMLGALVLDDPAPVVGLMVLGLTLHPFTLAGLFCTPNDLSTKYAGAYRKRVMKGSRRCWGLRGQQVRAWIVALACPTNSAPSTQVRNSET